MRVVLTRPADQAGPWLAGLQAAGLSVVSWPLIEIQPTRDAASLQAAREQAAQCQAIMFVSPNAVAGFYKPNRPLAQVNIAQAAVKNVANQSLDQHQALRCWATGAGTVQALLQAGVPPAQIDAPGAQDESDSEALWARVRDQVRPGTRVLLVRGADAQGQLAGRPWLAEQISGAGAQLMQVAAYERHAPHWSAAQCEQANSALQDGSLWLWSSREALHNLPPLPGMQAGRARALATHPRIAQAALARGFASVHTAAPELTALVRSIQSLHHDQPPAA